MQLAEVMRRVHFGYRESPTGFRGSHGSYIADVSRSGSVTVTPYHHPRRGSRAEREDEHGLPRRTREHSPALSGAAVTIDTHAISHGGVSLPVAARSTRINDRGELLIDRGIAVEHLDNRAEGIEQSWHFDQRPAGKGALTLRVTVSGAALTATTAQGLHFGTTATTVGLRYSQAVWVDANGRRTAVPARWEAGEVVLEVSDETLTSTRWPAVLDPTIGPEFGIDRTAVSGPAGDNQYSPRSAGLGAEHLVVWQDFRDHTTFDVWAARVKSTGEVVDTGGIRITDATGDQVAPTVTAVGDHYFVAWEDWRTGTAQVYGRRVSAMGVPTSAEFLLTPAGAFDGLPSVASNGTHVALSWTKYDVVSGFYNVVARSITPTNSLEAVGSITNAPGQHSLYSATAFDGFRTIVVWEQYDTGFTIDVHGRMLDPITGATSGSVFVASNASYNQHAPSVACNGAKRCFVAWHDTRNSSISVDIYGTGIDTAPTNPVALNGASTGLLIQNRLNARVEFPEVAYGGGLFLVVWQDNNDGIHPRSHISSQRISDAALPAFVGTELPIVGSAGGTLDNYSPAVSFASTSFLVSWLVVPDSTLEADIRGTLINPDASPASGLLTIAQVSESVHHTPATAFSSGIYAVVWEDYRNPSAGYDILGARFTSTGAFMDELPTIAGTTNAERNPSILGTLGRFHVTWERHHDTTPGSSTLEENVYVRWFDANFPHTSSSAEQLVAGTIEREGRPKLCASGALVYVVFERGNQAMQIMGRLMPALSTPGAEFTIASSIEPLRLGGVSHRCALAYERFISWDNHDVHYCRWGATSFPCTAVATTAADERTPTTAVSDESGLKVWVAWSEYRAATDWDIRARRFDVLTPELDLDLAATTATERNPVGALGQNVPVLFAWERVSGGTIEAFARRIDSLGNNPDTGWSGDLAPSTSNESSLSLAMNLDTPSQFIFVYHRPMLSNGMAGDRVYGRVLSF